MMYFVKKIEIQYRYMAKEEKFPSRCLESCENADKLNSLKGLDEN